MTGFRWLVHVQEPTHTQSTYVCRYRKKGGWGVLQHALTTGGRTTPRSPHRRYPSRLACGPPGLPLIGHLNVPDQLVNVPYMFLSGRQDRIVPIDGTESDQGWFYVTAAEAARAYAEVRVHRSHNLTRAMLWVAGRSVNTGAAPWCSVALRGVLSSA